MVAIEKSNRGSTPRSEVEGMMSLQVTNAILNEAKDGLAEALWSGKVKTKWKPPEGFFKQGASKIASGLKRVSKDAKQAMGRLNFYINRAGRNLSPEDMARLNSAKKKLQKLYA